eukprot:954097-Pelagomonas_calceolata.AAC.2
MMLNSTWPRAPPTRHLPKLTAGRSKKTRGSMTWPTSRKGTWMDCSGMRNIYACMMCDVKNTNITGCEHLRVEAHGVLCTIPITKSFFETAVACTKAAGLSPHPERLRGHICLRGVLKNHLKLAAWPDDALASDALDGGMGGGGGGAHGLPAEVIPGYNELT